MILFDVSFLFRSKMKQEICMLQPHLFIKNMSNLAESDNSFWILKEYFLSSQHNKVRDNRFMFNLHDYHFHITFLGAGRESANNSPWLCQHSLEHSQVHSFPSILWLLWCCDSSGAQQNPGAHSLRYWLSAPLQKHLQTPGLDT